MAGRCAPMIVAPWVALALVACEPRAPEPIPSARSEPPSGAAGVASTQPGPSVPLELAACVEAWPEKPVREVTGTVPAPSCPDDPGPQPQLALGVVRFPDIAGVEVAVELAKKNADRMRGLMYRKELGDNAGMLFVFEEERALQFWMKNTCIPLDMIFISDKGVVVGVEENTPMLSTDTFGPSCPARFVLEVNAGWARKHGVRPGTRVDLPR
ncbi:MAG: DUF192 domain-containing protein [Myxococcales bacterium]|nr:DUF192 domain-containing protein [Myxococcales bacterium]